MALLCVIALLALRTLKKRRRGISPPTSFQADGARSRVPALFGVSPSAPKVAAKGAVVAPAIETNAEGNRKTGKKGKTAKSNQVSPDKDAAENAKAAAEKTAAEAAAEAEAGNAGAAQRAAPPEAEGAQSPHPIKTLQAAYPVGVGGAD